MGRGSGERAVTGIRGRDGAGRPVGVVALICLLVLQGVSGVAGGVGLVMDPTGEALGIPLEWLAGSPFESYRVPGAVLLTVLGIGPLIVALAAWQRRSWAWTGALLVGLGLLVWLGVQVAVVGYRTDPPLQAAYTALAVAILVVLFLPDTRRHLRR